MNFSGVSGQVWVRTIVLIVALINQGLNMAGLDVLPFAEEQVADAVTTLFTVVASIWAWWKNNSFTNKAQEADKVLRGER